MEAYLTYRQHEWFVKFNSCYEDADYVYNAMEYIPIGNISKAFMNNCRWNESDTKVVIEQLLQGLVVMHGDGITHRDRKPEVGNLPTQSTVTRT
jgi:serine/threonine protein kinase